MKRTMSIVLGVIGLVERVSSSSSSSSSRLGAGGWEGVGCMNRKGCYGLLRLYGSSSFCR